MLLPFTHTASTHGSTVVQNALFGLRRSVDHERIPWVTFTAPEVARVGLSVAEARAPYPTWNEDLTAASLEDLRASLARVRPLTRALSWLRRSFLSRRR
jgi:pyruvate/2-oxoglutarate dehydrogenase complex dihydrolipoamide dehydrogenase (E3) component